MATIRWLTFAWGCLASLTMAYYAISWVSELTNPLRNELGIGFGMGMINGWPAWLGLPVLVFIGRQNLSRTTVLVLLAPVILAVVTSLTLDIIQLNLKSGFSPSFQPNNGCYSISARQQ